MPRGARRAVRRARGVHARRRRRPRRRAARRAARRSCERYERAQDSAPARSISSTCWSARATCVRDVDAVRADFQRRFTHLFVDEFQDTDPLQAEILLLLAADDPAATRLARASGRCPASSSSSAIRSSRSTASAAPTSASTRRDASCSPTRGAASRRSSPPASAPCRRSRRRQRRLRAADARRSRTRCRPTTCRSPRIAPSRAGQPSVVALPVPRPYGGDAASPRTRSSARCPTRSRAFVDWLFNESGWTVTERERSGRRACRSRRATSACCSAASTASSAATSRAATCARSRRAAIPHLLVGGKSFHDREEVETMRAALAAIEWPDDELSVFATLRGSLFAIGDEELFAVPPGAPAACIRSASPPICPPTLAPIGEALGAARRRCTAAATTGRSPTRSRGCSRRRARTPGSRCGRRASRRSPTSCTSPSWRAQYESRRRHLVPRLRRAAARGGRARRRPPRRRSSRRAATACAS